MYAWTNESQFSNVVMRQPNSSPVAVPDFYQIDGGGYTKLMDGGEIISESTTNNSESNTSIILGKTTSPFVLMFRRAIIADFIKSRMTMDVTGSLLDAIFSTSNSWVGTLKANLYLIPSDFDPTTITLSAANALASGAGNLLASYTYTFTTKPDAVGGYYWRSAISPVAVALNMDDANEDASYPSRTFFREPASNFTLVNSYGFAIRILPAITSADGTHLAITGLSAKFRLKFEADDTRLGSAPAWFWLY